MAKPFNGFADLLREHQGPLRSFLRRICWDFEEADDLAQETFVTAWERLDQFRGESTFRSWLFGIAFKKALASRRSGTRRATRETRWAEESRQQENPQPELRIDLRNALQELSDAQMAIISLCWGSDFSHDEAARALDLPIGTVKSHINRARDRLRAHMETSDGTD